MPSIEFDPDDNGGLIKVGDAIREHARQEGSASRDEEVAAEKARADAAEQRYADHMREPAPAGHPTKLPDDPPPDDEPTETVFGGSDGEWPVKGLPTTKALPAVRSFVRSLTDDMSWKTTGEMKNALDRATDTATVCWSFKEIDLSNLARLIDEFFDITKGEKELHCTYRHEPENDVKLGLSEAAKQADIAAYNAGWQKIIPVIRSHGALSASVLLGDRIDRGGPRNPESLAYCPQGVDIQGVDRYNTGLAHAKQYVDPRSLLGDYWGLVKEVSKRDGKDYDAGIYEWGSPAIGGDHAGRRAWAQKYVAEVRRVNADPSLPRVRVCCWWNAGELMYFDTDPSGLLPAVALGR